MCSIKKGYALIPKANGESEKIFFKCSHFEESSVWLIEYFFPIHTEISYKIDKTDNIFCFQGIRNYQRNCSKEFLCNSDKSILSAYAITNTSVHDIWDCISIIAMEKAQQYITIL